MIVVDTSALIAILDREPYAVPATAVACSPTFRVAVR
jgi:predicted nucleic acid-binding protein